MRYDIEADWTLLYTCNYRCRYCFWSPDTLGTKMAGLPGAAEWIEAFRDTGKTWLLHLTGGEPSLHPQFVALCEGLAERHYLSLNSNLSRPAIAEVARRVDPSRISLVHAALHPDQRIRREGWAAFARNVEVLQARGHRVLISVVATPVALAKFDTIARLCEPLGLRPVPKMLRGFHQGRRYPASYTPEERAAFRTASRWAREGYRELAASYAELPSVWPLHDDEWLDHPHDFRGRECDAGERFVAIHPDGNVFRCNVQDRLGNLLRGDFRTQPPRACDTSYCFYFCRKHSHAPLGGSVAARPIARAAPQGLPHS